MGESRLTAIDPFPEGPLGDLVRRYRPIVDNPQAFLEASVRPLPRVVWTNTLRVSTRRAERLVLHRCPQAQPIGWIPGAWRVPPEATPGKWLEFALGLLHVQEEITLVPVWALGPLPGQRVLDLCAAPGNKGADVAVTMGDRGQLVTNEINWRRLSSLHDTLSRLGVTCATVTRGDGRSYPGKEYFDRVLVDAPCTGEGTTRKSGGRTRSPESEAREEIVARQKGLLTRALGLTRPGGVIVYATCTYAPEENEAILSHVDPEQAVIEPLQLPPGLRATPGVRSWKGVEFRPDVTRALRFWPHHNDTGGFFVARLRCI